MVFANLSHTEKDAFFTLLDEYFASRPDVFGNAAPSPAAAPAPAPGAALANRMNAATGRAAASAIHNAFSSHANQHNEASAEPAWKRPQSTSPQPPAAESSVGRVAAAAAMFKPNSLSPASGPPRPPPRRLSSTSSSAEEAPPTPGRMPSQAGKLVAQKKFGDVDMTSGKNMFSSIRHGTANKSSTPPAVAPPIPAALPAIKNSFGPPPVRRVASTASEPRAAAAPPPPPPRRPEPEPEVDGDWAEALYEYTSEDPGDLELETGQRVLVVEKTSDDWWTAEYEGRRGLVPAAYVKLL